MGQTNLVGKGGPCFIWPVRVYHEDTDAGGVVYYANYLKFMERARSEWLRSCGYEQDALLREQGLLFAVRAIALEYKKPARFNDQLHVTVSTTQFGKASLCFSQTIFRSRSKCREELLTIGSVKAGQTRCDDL